MLFFGLALWHESQNERGCRFLMRPVGIPVTCLGMFCNCEGPACPMRRCHSSAFNASVFASEMRRGEFAKYGRPFIMRRCAEWIRGDSSVKKLTFCKCRRLRSIDHPSKGLSASIHHASGEMIVLLSCGQKNIFIGWGGPVSNHRSIQPY